MTPKQYGLWKLRERATRLYDALGLSEPTSTDDNGSPDILIAEIISSLQNPAMLYCPEAMKQVMMDNLRKTALKTAGFCPECEFKFPEGSETCPDCEKLIRRIEKTTGDSFEV